MKKILIAITACLLALVLLTGAAAAFELESSSVTPNGALSPGDSVTALAKIKIAGGSDASITLSTPLTDAVWVVKIMRGSVCITETGGAGTVYSLSSWSLKYDEDIELEISMAGKVGEELAGQSIKVITIAQDKNAGSSLSTYSSPEQQVYNPEEVVATASDLSTKLSNLKAVAQSYGAHGINMDAAYEKIAAAESYVNTAQNYGSSNLKAAFTALSNANSETSEAAKAVSNAGLTALKANIDKIDVAIATLIEQGNTNEANIVSTNLMEVRSAYNSLIAEYNAGSTPQCEDMLTKSESVNATATDFIVKGEVKAESNPFVDFITQYWWIIAIALGAIVLIIVVVILLRRRSGGWDELG